MIPALTSVRRRRRRPLDSPYIINDIVSTTLLTKQMYKSHCRESIDTETFNHVLNNDFCSHNAIIILRFWCAWMSAWEGKGIREALFWLTPTGEKKTKCFGGRHLYVEWQVKSGCQKMQWIFAVLFISWLPLNKSGGTCIACPSAFSSAP